ncbi:MMPL family transporter [Desulfovibrio litoralis]|uniref:MMPL family transporter n=1 Tax=Desulfovibrio litoralis TaxID=466107 RepID=UPI001160C89D|nr:MMPL family transporter [Desulfovibrio litoralis]
MSFSGIVFILSCFVSSFLLVKEDILVLLPNSPPELAKQFSLLRSAPFMRYTVITVSNGDNDPVPIMKELEEKLDSSGIIVLKNNTQSISNKTIISALRYIPSLLPERVYPDEISQLIFEKSDLTFKNYINGLRSLKGVFFQSVMSHDPFAFYTLLKDSLESLRPVPNTQLKDGYILSDDGKYGMLIVTANTHMNDSSAANVFMTTINNIVTTLPQNVSVIVSGAHRHTYENANIIQQDLKKIIPLSLVLIVGLFIVFLRSWNFLLLLCIPIMSLAVASAFTGLFFSSISGIVIGFGGVVLGITTDYAVHIYYALQGDQSQRINNLNIQGKTLTLAALTTVISFSVLSFSNIPVLYQLAVFAAFGLIFALLFALFVFPHIVPVCSKDDKQVYSKIICQYNKPTLILVWLVLFSVGLFLWKDIKIDGDIRSLGYQSEALLRDEQKTKMIWGNIKDSILLCVSEATLEKALEKNDSVYKLLSTNDTSMHVIGLASILPSQKTQLKRHQLWKEFWEQKKEPASKKLILLGEKYGFVKSAFQPFLDFLDSKPPLLTLDTLHELGVDRLTTMFINSENNVFRVYTLVENILELPENLKTELKKENVEFVSALEFRKLLGEESKKEIVKLSIWTFSLLSLLVLFLLRSLTKTAVALLPPMLSVLGILLYTNISSVPLNLFNVVAFPLVMGLSVDYGIFMVYRTTEQNNTKKAVALSALTTIATFGCLAFARHPTLHSLGITVFCGMSISLLTALFLIPALEKKVK